MAFELESVENSLLWILVSSNQVREYILRMEDASLVRTGSKVLATESQLAIAWRSLVLRNVL